VRERERERSSLGDVRRARGGAIQKEGSRMKEKKREKKEEWKDGKTEAGMVG
jgi:hypothetical protein